MGRAAFAVVAAGIALAACASAAKPALSWGKADVGYAQFLTDSAECALAGSAADVDMVTGDLDLVRNASPVAEPAVLGYISSEVPSTVSVNDSILRARHNERQRRIAEARARQAVIDACLTERGYVQFRLTPDQGAELGRLPQDSAARRRFLHRLGADAEVLASQRL